MSNAVESKFCLKCGQLLGGLAPSRLCSRCLLVTGFDETHTVTLASDGTAEEGVSARMPSAFGDYELLEEVARGGMGVVFKARQVSLNRIVAVKMILSGQLASEAEVKRFQTEAEAAANLRHPNIVAIHEVGEHEGRHYFSMDYIEGKNLADHIKDRPLPAAEAARIAKTLAEAVHFAHQRGTLHRDLKPHNVLMDSAGQPHITDFGVARRIEKETSLTQTGAALGSPNYMPPEQAAGRQHLVGPASDVYSLGVVLYQMLTGSVPFRGETPAATMVKVMEDDPASPCKLNPSVPKDLEAVCLKCLEKRPERRYHSAQTFAEELGRFLNHEPVQAKPASALRKAVNWSVRHPWVIAGFASMLVLGLLALVYGLWEQNHFLSWTISHPGYVRTAGARIAQVESIRLIATLMFIGLFVCFIALEVKSQSAPVREASNPRWFLIMGILGLTGISYAVFWILKYIDAYVWEALPNRVIPYLAFIFLLGSLLVGSAGREYFGLRRQKESSGGQTRPSVTWPKSRPSGFFAHFFLILLVTYVGGGAIVFGLYEIATRTSLLFSILIGVALCVAFVVAARKSARWRPAVLALLGGSLFLPLEQLAAPALIRGSESDLHALVRGAILCMVWALAASSARAFAAHRANQNIPQVRKDETP